MAGPIANLTLMPRRPPTEAEADGPPRVAFVTLGCKVNQSDTQQAIGAFRSAGFQLVPPSAPAEVYVVNTCSVTSVADRKSRAWLRRVARANPAALVVATGCYAESGAATLAEMPEVGLIVTPRQGDELVRLVLDGLPDAVRARTRGRVTMPSFVLPERLSPLPDWATTDGDSGAAAGDDPDLWAVDAAAGMRTRAMVKVEDGCNDFCTFCIIPFTRGMPRSTPTAGVLKRVRARVAGGAQEIVLTGTHMGKYGSDHAQRKRAAADPDEAPDLPALVAQVLTATNVPRLRLTSLEPTDAVALLPLFAHPQAAGRLARHLHLPLQSGCDATLARMRRDYDTAEYARIVAQVRDAVPDIGITTDVIVGFPGETEAEFAETCAFVESLGFLGVHVFPYSGRPGTPALTMPGQIDPPTRHARWERLTAIGAAGHGAFATAMLDRILPVLWESGDAAGGRGLTDNYLRVQTTRPVAPNTITPARITAFDAAGLWAEPVG
ncbi:MAG: radical SAM protein [Chloroflexota bacterium]|nr:radical SAM protein [Chloroflexota bacterium]